jgi:hypothetical protein
MAPDYFISELCEVLEVSRSATTAGGAAGAGERAFEKEAR